MSLESAVAPISIRVLKRRGHGEPCRAPDEPWLQFEACLTPFAASPQLFMEIKIPLLNGNGNGGRLLTRHVITNTANCVFVSAD